MQGRLRLSASATVFVAVALGQGLARADAPIDKQACLAASEKGQEAKIAGKLRLAREQFQVCARSECPAIVRNDCTQWTSDVLNALPSVVVGARDSQGHDVFNVRVSIDGAVVADALDGKPIPIDPGVHEFKYDSPASASGPVIEKVLIREGEKNRTLTVHFASPAIAPPPPPPVGAPAAAAPIQAETKGPPSALAYVFTGVGVAALGTSLGLLLWGNNEVAQDERPVGQGGCRGSACDLTTIKTKWALSGVALGVGVVSLGVATYFFIARPTLTKSPSDADTKRAGLWFDVAPAAQGGAVGVLGGHF